MKKFFLFRSSTDKQVSVEHSSKTGSGDKVKKNDESLRRSLFKAQKHASENLGLDNNSCLRRSRSFSSAAFDAPAYRNPSCFIDQDSSPSSSSSVKAQHHQPSRSCTLTPERHVKTKRNQEFSLHGDHGVHKRVPSCHFKDYNDSSGDSSRSSSNVSNEVLDLYIDGEQQNERNRQGRRTTWKGHTVNGGDKKPPRSHCTAPASPSGSIKGRSRTDSFRGGKGSHVSYLSRDWVESGYVQECPQDLAKHVVERLCQNHISHRTNTKDYDSDVPITIEDVYNGSLSRNSTLKSNAALHKDFLSDRVYTTIGEYQTGDYQGVEDNKCDSFSAGTEDELDVELKCKLKEAQERILVLSEELEQEAILRDNEFNVPALVQRIKHLTEEKISLALDLSAVLERQLTDRASLKEQLSSARLELDSQTRRLEKEKNDLQSTLEKEFDRRSSDWSSKLEKYQVEEQRLRERVRELAEQNVFLQRERRNLMSFEKQVNDLTCKLEEAQRDNQDLSQSLCELQDKYKVTEESRDSMLNSYEEKQEECKELHVCVARLTRTCGEQEKTIDGLRGELAEFVQKRIPVENFDKRAQKLQMELVRLTGIELGLRKEAESCKLEADSLRLENINLLNRIKEGGSLTFKLDQELWARLHCLQKQGLSSLNDSVHLCLKLLESIKRVGQSVGKKEGIEVNRNCFDAQFVIESEVKVQGFRRGIESLTKSLQNIATILEEKSGLEASKSQAQCRDGRNLQDQTRSELKVEKLLTSLLREKLYAKDQEVEQLQAEVASVVRGNEILRCEVQNVLDSLSCVTHRMKELEIEIMKKDEKINQLETDLQGSTKQLTIIKGILPKVTDERDMMWQEVKQYAEKNMLLDSEVKMLKKKIDALDEDVLLKEGQISILKDSLGRKSFDLLTSPDRTHEFLVE